MGGRKKRKKKEKKEKTLFKKSLKNPFFPFSKKNLYEIKTQIYFSSSVLMILLRSQSKMYPNFFREKYGRKKRRKVSFQNTIENDVFVFPK